ncbi:MAG: sensor histidine kinase [Clostridia bacterium]|nr:sensor histidine kinase [Clostridia bacterium]
MTKKSPNKHKLSLEILATVAVCFGVCLILYLLLGFVGRSIVDSYCFYHDVYLDEFALRKLDNTVAGIAFVISALCFAGAFLALFAKKLAYIRQIIAGVHALQQGNYDYLVEVEGSNELTALAEAVNYLSESERELKQKESELAAQKEQLIRSLSHDIRTPLTSIMSYTELLGAKLGAKERIDEQEQRAYLALVGKKTAQIKQLTDILLDGGRRNVEYFDHAKLLFEQLAGEFEEALEDAYPLTVKLSLQADLTGNFDVGELRRIFDNPITNVQKYADPAKEIVLEIAQTDAGITLRQSNAIRKESTAAESYQMGVYSMRRIAQNYGGGVEITQTTETFEIRIILANL